MVITDGMLNATINGIKINTSIPCRAGNYTNYTKRDIKYVIIHYTGNTSDKAVNNAKYYNSNGARQASAHFFVDDTSIYQSVEMRDMAWHVGAKTYYHSEARNTNTVGIEMCCSGNYIVSDKTKTNAAYMCAYLCQKLGISSDKVDTFVLRHYDVTHKTCPRQMAGANNTEWAAFKLAVKGILDGQQVVQNKSVSTLYNGVDFAPVFDATFYANKYADLKSVYGTNAEKLFDHFCKFGMKEGRQAKAEFKWDAYKTRYADLSKVYGNDKYMYYWHYCVYGVKEGRKGI